ncbi:hypothetical protein [Tenacibaculum jejuense]|uniref:YbjN domain-containing protein n=1 Tax=Tenacibaculum jejuense TaxID=584609 RepID=A0A238UDI6_9FLAO|nr:hypothetical protein [Tenacibaculum jejuense]SNR17239.1 conserved protein of unknown function [Tenacibaculum jejuense]
MNNEKLLHVLKQHAHNIEGNEGYWSFQINEIAFMCLTDKLHNRMRIIAPITEADDLTDAQLSLCMEANFHTTLDIRYAISDGILWSAFIHPLKELTEHQIEDALSQVYSSVKTFGSTYSSGSLSFLTEEERKFRLN